MASDIQPDMTAIPSGTPGAQGATGSTGSTGSAGAAGGNAYTTLTSGFTQPAVNSTVQIAVGSTAWMVVDLAIYVAVGGTYRVVSVDSALLATIRNLGAAGNASPAASVASGGRVVAGLGATVVTAFGTLEGEVDANASAITALDARVTTSEGTIVSHASSLTSLTSSVSLANTGVTANASAISLLETDVTSIDGLVTSHTSSITTLQAQTASLAATAVQFSDAFVDSGTGDIVARYGFNLTAGDTITTMEAIAQDGPTPVSAIKFSSGTSLESSNFVTGTSGWQIDGAGSAEFADVTVRGTLYSDVTAFFLVSKSGAQNITGNGTRDKVVWGTETTDLDNCFSTADSRFTAPVDGLYDFFVTLRHSGGGSGIQKIVEFRKNGTDNVYEFLAPETDETGAQDLQVTCPSLQLDAGDYIEVWMEINDTGSATYPIDSTNTRFIGKLIQRL